MSDFEKPVSLLDLYQAYFAVPGQLQNPGQYLDDYFTTPFFSMVNHIPLKASVMMELFEREAHTVVQAEQQEQKQADLEVGGVHPSKMRNPLFDTVHCFFSAQKAALEVVDFSIQEAARQLSGK